MNRIFIFIGGPHDGEIHPVPDEVNTFDLERVSIDGKHITTYFRKQMIPCGLITDVFTYGDMCSSEVIQHLVNGYHNRPRH